MDTEQQQAPAAEPEQAPYEYEPPEAEDQESGSESAAGQPAQGDEAEAGQGELQAPEVVEVEFNGKTYNVPADLKDNIMMQADYTRKTQELAEQRRQFEAQAATPPQQVQEQDLQDRGYAMQLEQQLQQYENVDWDAWENQDFLAAQQAWRARQQMTEDLRNAKERISQREHQRTAVQQQTFAKQVQETQSRVAKDAELKGWGQDLAVKVTENATKAYGIPDRDVQMFNASYGYVKMAHDAYKWREHLKKTTQSQAPKPLEKPKGRAAPPPRAVSDKQDIDAWMKSRNRQVGR